MTDITAETLQALPHMIGTAPDLDLDALPDSPLELFVEWFRLALDAGVPEAKAVTLSTVDANGLPDARIVDLAAVGEDGVTFGTGANSVKSRQLKQHDLAALSFWWQPQIRAVRLRGPVTLKEPAPGFALCTLAPTHVEFWQSTGEHSAIRIFYTRTETGWDREVVQ